MKNISSEFKLTTSGWTVANTKQCPKCKIPIEKNKGCNHMTCKCGFHFCWLCLHSPCICYGSNRLQVQEFLEIFGNEVLRNHEKSHLDRYTYYHQGWANNEIARKKALQNLIQMSSIWKKPSTYLNFKDAWKQIIECRRIIKWSYVCIWILSSQE